MKKLVLGFGGLVAFVAFAIGMQYLDDTRWAKQLGEECDQDSVECPSMFGELYCVDSFDGTYCTPECATDSDCPAEWVCEITTERHNVLLEDHNGVHLRPGESPPWEPEEGDVRTCRRPSE